MTTPCEQRWQSAAAILGTRLPVIQAGMGGVAGPELAAAVSDAGALGTIGLYRMPAQSCHSAVVAVQRATDRPFGVNVIPEVAGGRLLAEQLDAVLEVADRRIVVNVYGVPPADLVTTVRCHRHVLVVQLGTEAELLDAEADAVVVQGTEAGGHLLGHSSGRELLTRVSTRRTDIPVLAAGGIAGPRSLSEALVAGAWGAQVGTAFVVASESRAHDEYKRLLVSASRANTVVTDRFDHGWPGRSHRVLRTEAAQRTDPAAATGFVAVDRDARGRRVLIVRGSANVPLRTTEGAVDQMALYAGVGVDDISDVATAAEVVHRLVRGVEPETSSPPEPLDHMCEAL